MAGFEVIISGGIQLIADSFTRMPLKFNFEERDGWCLEGFISEKPWGGVSLTLLARYRLGGKPGDTVREVFDRSEFRIPAGERTALLQTLRAWHREVAAGVQQQPAAAALPDRSGRRKKKSGWTQGEVNEAIRDYAQRKARLLQKLEGEIAANQRGAKKIAISHFGRNAVQRKLGCSAGLVSKSTAWRAIAVRLKLLGDTPGVSRSVQIGIDRATDNKSEAEWKRLAAEQAAEEEADQRPPRRRPRE